MCTGRRVGSEGVRRPISDIHHHERMSSAWTVCLRRPKERVLDLVRGESDRAYVVAPP